MFLSFDMLRELHSVHLSLFFCIIPSWKCLFPRAGIESTSTMHVE